MNQPVSILLFTLTLLPGISFADEQDRNGPAAAAVGAGIVAGAAGAIDLGHTFNLKKEDKEALLARKAELNELRKEAGALADQRAARAELIARDEIEAFQRKYRPSGSKMKDYSRQFRSDSAALLRKLRNDPEYVRLSDAINEKMSIVDGPDAFRKVPARKAALVRGAGLVGAGAAAYVYGISEMNQEKIEQPQSAPEENSQEPNQASAELGD